MIDCLVSGKVFGAPEQRVSKIGNGYVRLKIRVPTSDGQSVLCTAFAFSESVQTHLLAMSAGDPVCVAGTLTMKPWVNSSGDPAVNADITVSSVMSPYSVKKKRDAAATESKSSIRALAQNSSVGSSQMKSSDGLESDEI